LLSCDEKKETMSKQYELDQLASLMETNSREIIRWGVGAAANECWERPEDAGAFQAVKANELVERILVALKPYLNMVMYDRRDEDILAGGD
jgi:hypothetical protein